MEGMRVKRERMWEVARKVHKNWRVTSRFELKEAKNCARPILPSFHCSPGCNAQTERADFEQRYHKLLQEHMQCGVTIAKLEAQQAEFQAFMQRFRTALSNEVHGTQG
jgi:hypothetical protein